MTALEEWLRNAPTPPPLKPDQKWHVFLSYRSVHRRWVIQLYDVLRSLGFEVFLDQYVLGASVNLIGGLEEGLEKSASGVLVWSTATEDSKWCTKEYRSMEMRETNDDTFHYVIATLDQVELPEFAQQKLYVDFSAYREGPTGTGLLKLLYGLSGQPLPDAAIRLATSVDEETTQSLAAIRSALETGNHRRLMELAPSKTLPWMTSAMLGCEVVESLTKLKRYDEALSVIQQLEERFPKAIRVRQLKGLALARKGDREAAQDVLGDLVNSGEQDPETLGIYARTWMDRYEESHNELHLRKSRDLYAQAFANAPRDYYTGINAAAKSVFLGELQAAEEYANKVEALVGTQKRDRDYWGTATVAEIQLIKRNYLKAAELYKAAVAMATEETGSHETTWKQAQRLMEKLGPSAEERAAVASAFAHLG
jgi:tetratricopeptide (TPR) repeat protein